MNQIFLYPGQMVVCEDPAALTTLLGSCVGVAMYDPKHKRVGLNHFLLPETGAGDQPSPRYGSFAIPALIEEFKRLGSNPRDLIAKVYGGANVLSNVLVGQKIGERNIEIAMRLLQEFGIPIREKDLGGTSGRKIVVASSDFSVKHTFSSRPDGEGDVSGFSALRTARDVKVVIVDDSATVRNIFHKIFVREGLKVVGLAVDPFEAREIIVREKPDVITLDIEMPKMNGVRFLEALMRHQPMPVVMVSSLGSQGEAAMECLRLGALEFVHKPSQFDPAVLRVLAETLVAKVRAAATSKILPKRTAEDAPASASSSVAPVPTARGATRGGSGGVRGIFVSGNTGAPKSLTRLLGSFTADTPPVVIAVSTVCPFLENFVKDMSRHTGLALKIAENGMRLSTGVGYFVPADHNARVVNQAGALALELERGRPLNGQLPSGDPLMESAAQTLGSAAAGVLLSGFGTDGVHGLTRIHAAGGVTLVETPDEASFPFVPQSAIAAGVVDQVVKAGDIFALLMKYRSQRAA